MPLLTYLLTTRGYTAKMNKFRSSLNIRRFLFSEKVDNCWNVLHQIDRGLLYYLEFLQELTGHNSDEKPTWASSRTSWSACPLASSVPEILHRSRCCLTW